MAQMQVLKRPLDQGIVKLSFWNRNLGRETLIYILKKHSLQLTTIYIGVKWENIQQEQRTDGSKLIGRYSIDGL